MIIKITDKKNPYNSDADLFLNSIEGVSEKIIRAGTQLVNVRFKNRGGEVNVEVEYQFDDQGEVEEVLYLGEKIQIVKETPLALKFSEYLWSLHPNSLFYFMDDVLNFKKSRSKYK